jgi:hypothetical protein
MTVNGCSVFIQQGICRSDVRRCRLLSLMLPIQRIKRPRDAGGRVLRCKLSQRNARYVFTLFSPRGILSSQSILSLSTCAKNYKKTFVREGKHPVADLFWYKESRISSYFRFPRQRIWRWLSSGMLRHSLVETDRCFRGAYFLHQQINEVAWTSEKQASFCETTRRNMPQYSRLYNETKNNILSAHTITCAFICTGLYHAN